MNKIISSDFKEIDINPIIENITREHSLCVFISPHLDDAVFSAGELILRLAPKVKVVLITVFTEAEKSPYTLSAKMFLKKSEYKNALELFYARRLEDIEACGEMKIDYIHLNLIDASFRKKGKKSNWLRIFDSLIPEAGHIYPIYRINVVSGRVSKKDKDTLRAVEKKFKDFKEEYKKSFVFCPIGLGGHVDHILVRDICRKVFYRLIFWEDFPYNFEIRKKDKLGNSGWKDNLELLNGRNINDRKKEIMSIYKSQIGSMFPCGIFTLPERYFIAREFNVKLQVI